MDALSGVGRDFKSCDHDFALMFDAACFLLRSYDLYSLLNAGIEGKNGQRYKAVMRELICLTARARVRCAMDVSVPDDLFEEE